MGYLLRKCVDYLISGYDQYDSSRQTEMEFRAQQEINNMTNCELLELLRDIL